MTNVGRASGPRREPVQQRSALRVDRMLDAAAELLAQGGYAVTTTTAVAARAGVSIGSLYQFFPDRDAILQALARRSFDRFTTVLSHRLAGRRIRSWQRMLDLVVDTYVEVLMSEPSGRALSFGGAYDRRALQSDADNTTVVADALGRLLLTVRPDLVLGEDLRLGLRVAVEAADAVLTMAMPAVGEVDARLVAEVKALLRRYLAPHIRAARRPPD